jgi:16S rRNA U516 pseudouridylate synthase RsuA-like enzyme
MCEHLGYKVTRLVRIRVMNINLGRLKTGIWRNVTNREIEELNRVLDKNEEREF